MIANVKDWKHSQGKQFIVLERDSCFKNYAGKDYITKVKTLNFPFNHEFSIGQQIYLFNDVCRQIRVKIIANIISLHEDMIGLTIQVTTYTGENVDKEHDDADWNRTVLCVEMDDLKEYTFFLDLRDRFMREALEREK